MNAGLDWGLNSLTGRKTTWQGIAISAGLGCAAGALGGVEMLPGRNGGLGRLLQVNSPDAAADKLALRIGGRSRVRFEFGPDNEFDVVSWRYVAQTKPANLTYGSDWREQAKTTFEVGIKTGRTPYFHFDGPPKAAVLRALDRYADRYGIKPIIDLVPLGG